MQSHRYTISPITDDYAIVTSLITLTLLHTTPGLRHKARRDVTPPRSPARMRVGVRDGAHDGCACERQ
jgi:hypothetical protein